MDTQSSAIWSFTLFALVILAVILTPAAWAQDPANDPTQICQTETIYQAFKQPGSTVDQVQLSEIQNQLNINDYGTLTRDGLWGPATRQALRRLCLDFRIKTEDGLAEQLIVVLQLATTVGRTITGWRQLIQREGFKNWLNQQPEQQQQGIATTLQSGPAEQIIAILQRYQQSQAALSEKKPVKPQVNSAMHLNQESGPAIFYRWQADAEQPEADEVVADQATDGLPLDDLKVIEGVAYPNKVLFSQALEQLFSASASGCDLYCQNQILDQARNGPLEELQEIQLSGGNCGCSRVYSEYSLVYGFYPFWQATGDVQQVDFSLFDRIGFYALSLNEAGVIRNSLQWSDQGDAAAFIAKAHRYRVKVDLIVYASNWQNWSDDAIRTSAHSVSDAVTERFNFRYTKGLRAIFPFLTETTSVQADGVTLYFDNYKESSESKQMISIVLRVAEALKKAGSDAKLNIMLGLDMASIETKGLFNDLACILLDDVNSKDKRESCDWAGEQNNPAGIDYVLAFLPERTTDSKKILRRSIEDDFHGQDRKTVLRKVVPIIPPSGHEIDQDESAKPFSQFEDDLIYFKDNFAGAGLWPLPLESHQDIDAIKKHIIDLYQETNGKNRLGTMIDSYAPWLCTFACPNRWLFRLGFYLLAGSLLIYAVSAFFVCRLRALFKQYLWYFLGIGALTILIRLTSLVCDPDWHDRADRAVMAVVILSVVVIIWKNVSKATRPPLP